MKRKYWTEEEREKLKQLYPTTLGEDLAEIFNCPVHSIYNQANRLGLKKDIEFIRQVAKENFSEDHPARKYWIKKGTTPPNKGKKQKEYMSKEAIERTKATRFKKGNIPHNAVPIGYERVDRDGYVYIKVKGKRKLVLKHRHIWEQHNGPIPKGFNIQFKDGNTHNCDINNLYMISRDDQMEHNSIVRYPSGLRTALRRISKINKLIKQ